MKIFTAAILGACCISALFLTGCASAVSLEGNFDMKAFRISCGFQSACYRKAAALCPDGYTLGGQQLTDNQYIIVVTCK
jgi:hypothetical protein